MNLDEALREFDAAEANLTKLERIWQRIRELIPDGIAFGAPPEYEELCLAFRAILPSVPAIDGVKVGDHILEYDEIGQWRMDAREIGEVSAEIALDKAIEEQGRDLSRYRFHFNAQRMKLVRDRILALVEIVDQSLRRLTELIERGDAAGSGSNNSLADLENAVAEITALLGSTKEKPKRWDDLHRHLRFGTDGDLLDIARHDWPSVKAGLMNQLYGQYDPLPVAVGDLSELVAAKPRGAVATSLNWKSLDAESFERLLFLLIAESQGYENPEWLQHTNAADRGRDLSVTRVWADSLSGVRRQRVIVQCKHWLSRSVGPADVSEARDLMALWEPPRVDVLVIATSGRFTADAISLIERHNQANVALYIDLWPESHLERMLAAKPHLIAEFNLRQ